MGRDDHYVFMDGCIVKGCKPYINFEQKFGEYATLLHRLYQQERWGRDERRFLGVPLPGNESFSHWMSWHVHTAQSTQNMRTGASRVDEILRGIRGHGNIHLFGTSAAGSAILEYFLLTNPDTLYYNLSDRDGSYKPGKRYKLDSRIASFTSVDAPGNWIPLRRDGGLRASYFGPGSLGRYLVSHTRIKAGPHVPSDRHTTRMEDVPHTWVESQPVAGIDYDDRPRYNYLPKEAIARHMYTGSHMSEQTGDFLSRVLALGST